MISFSNINKQYGKQLVFVETGSPDVTITINGRNFQPSTVAAVTRQADVSSADTLPLQFVNPNQLKLTLTADHFVQPGSWNLALMNSFNQSNVIVIKAVPPGLPPAPIVTSITPAELPAMDSPQDIVVSLHGSNFIPGDTIVSSAYASQPLTYTVVSPNQIDVVVPAIWQIYPLNTQFIVSSAQDSDLQSAPLDFAVDNTLNALLDPQPPEIVSVNDDGYVALAEPASNKPVKIKVITLKDVQPKIKIKVDGQDVQE
jgi:hypothetical protein